MKSRSTDFPYEPEPAMPAQEWDRDRFDAIDEPSELDEIDLDDERWEAFLADDDELDPLPDRGDFTEEGVYPEGDKR